MSSVACASRTASALRMVPKRSEFKLKIWQEVWSKRKRMDSENRINSNSNSESMSFTCTKISNRVMLTIVDTASEVKHLFLSYWCSSIHAYCHDVLAKCSMIASLNMLYCGKVFIFFLQNSPRGVKIIILGSIDALQGYLKWSLV